MYAAIRCYRVDPELRDEAVRHIHEDFRPLIEGLPGCLAYYVLDSEDGSIATVSIFRDRAGVEASNRTAAEGMKRYLTERIFAQDSLSRFFLEVEETLQGPLYGEATEEHPPEEPPKPQASPGSGLLSVGEVCEELGMGKSWVYRKIRGGEIPSIRLGRDIKVRREDLEAYIEGQRR